MVINAYLLSQRLPVSYRHASSLPAGSRSFHLALSQSIISAYGQKLPQPRKSSYIRKFSTPRYSKLQNKTTLPEVQGTIQDHKFIHFKQKRLECTQCRFILRNMNQKGQRAPTTRYGCSGPGCGFSLCENCYDSRHKRLHIL